MKKILYLVLALLAVGLALFKILVLIGILWARNVPTNADFAVPILALVFFMIFLVAYYRVDTRQKRKEIEELKRHAKRR